MQHFQSFVTFWSVRLMKANIAMSLRGFVLEWYTSELSNFKRNALNNDSSMKSWINTLSHYFKILTSVALDLPTNETYFLDNTCAWQPPA